MLDQQIAQIAGDRIRLEIAEQNARVETDIGQIKEEMLAVGALNSSDTLVRIAALCAEAAKARAQFAWKIVYRFVTTGGVSYNNDLAGELKCLVLEFLPQSLDDLKGYAKKEAERLDNRSIVAQLEQKVEEGRALAVAKINNEIDLFTISLRNQHTMSSEKPKPTVVNIYSPVGPVQTGTNAVAYISQTFDATSRADLNKALDRVEAALVEVASLPEHPKGEVVDIVREAKAEVKKPEPNSTKLRSLLITTATAIQTVAALKPAYEALKSATLFLGINLP